MPKMSTAFLEKTNSEFAYIKPNAEGISNIIEKYDYRDAVRAVFCLNLWRQNRSALAQGLSMNMALTICTPHGTQRIQSYEDLTLFYEKISEYIKITRDEDYIIDDYGEVFINHAGKSYPVIIGTGHQQVYAALRYMQTLASNIGCDGELIAILEYLSTIIRLTEKTNTPNTASETTHKLPS